MQSVPKSSPLGLLVLLQLKGEPMHVYRMQKLIEGQAKDRVVNVRSRASLYQTVTRLERHGLVEVESRIRGVSQPDRTLYTITESGRQVAREWLRQMLVETEGEFPAFVAAVSMLFALPPDEALEVLEERVGRLTQELEDVERQLDANVDIPRLFLLEEEYRGVTLRAELAWVRAVCTDIRGGTLTWDEDWIREIAGRFNPAPDDG
jgi:DNA-binding PadR family transcriptional regulator